MYNVLKIDINTYDFLRHLRQRNNGWPQCATHAHRAVGKAGNKDPKAVYAKFAQG